MRWTLMLTRDQKAGFTIAIAIGVILTGCVWGWALIRSRQPARADTEPIIESPGEAHAKDQDRIRAEAEQRALADRRAEEAIRGPRPEPSPWDGITPEANEWLKKNLRDYKSLSLVECSVVAPYGATAWCQRVLFRANNGFGGTNLEEYVFVIRNHIVIDAISR